MNWIQGIGRIFIQDIHEAIAESVPVAIAIRVLLDAFADRIAVFNDCIGHSLLIGIWPAGFRIYFVDIAEGRQRIGYFDAPLGHCAGKMVHILDPILFSANLKVTIQQIGINDRGIAQKAISSITSSDNMAISPFVSMFSLHIAPNTLIVNTLFVLMSIIST